jgi:hypothetical protein
MESYNEDEMFQNDADVGLSFEDEEAPPAFFSPPHPASPVGEEEVENISKSVTLDLPFPSVGVQVTSTLKSAKFITPPGSFEPTPSQLSLSTSDSFASARTKIVNFLSDSVQIKKGTNAKAVVMPAPAEIDNFVGIAYGSSANPALLTSGVWKSIREERSQPSSRGHPKKLYLRVISQQAKQVKYAASYMAEFQKRSGYPSQQESNESSLFFTSMHFLRLWMFHLVCRLYADAVPAFRPP